MNFSKGFSARYYITILNPESWRDIKRYEITSGNIDRNITDSLQEAADVVTTEKIESGEAWIRIWLDARKVDGSSQHLSLFTGLLTSPERDIDGVREKYKAECYSVLKPPSDMLLDRGWYAQVDIPGAEIVARLLSATPAPIKFIKNSPKLKQEIVAENGETYLSMANRILTAIDWKISIDGLGKIYIHPKNEFVSGSFGLENDIVELSITDKKDWFSCPNVLRVISGDDVAIARNDNPNSLLSTISRKREIWMEESKDEIKDGEDLAEYTNRRLKEESKAVRTISYTRRFQPDIYPGDLIKLHYPAHDLRGIFRIQSQKITLGHGLKTKEEVVSIE